MSKTKKGLKKRVKKFIVTFFQLLFWSTKAKRDHFHFFKKTKSILSFFQFLDKKNVQKSQNLVQLLAQK